MKKYLIQSLLFVALILGLTACSNNDEVEPKYPQIPEIVVTVDENGQADGGHSFSAIDGINYCIDGILYRAWQNHLMVTGFNAEQFKGEARIISALNYQEQHLKVTEINGGAFRDCSSLTSAIIPEGVTHIKDAAFSDCSNLTKINLPRSLTEIGGYAFYKCSALTSAIIPDSVSSIPDGAFQDCKGLTSLVLSNGIKYIRFNAFRGCSALTAVTIPDSTIDISPDAFLDCSSLSSIKVSSGNPAYDSRNGCNALIWTAENVLVCGCKNTRIPNDVTSIGSYAFSDCSGLTSITIPNSVTSIGDWAFYYCI